MPDCLTLLLVCVYLTFDNGLYSGHFDFQETLDQLEGFIDSQDYDMLAVVGDFNVDLDRRHTNVLLQLMLSLYLRIWTLPMYSSLTKVMMVFSGSCTDLSDLCTKNTGN